MRNESDAPAECRPDRPVNVPLGGRGRPPKHPEIQPPKAGVDNDIDENMAIELREPMHASSNGNFTLAHAGKNQFVVHRGFLQWLGWTQSKNRGQSRQGVSDRRCENFREGSRDFASCRQFFCILQLFCETTTIQGLEAEKHRYRLVMIIRSSPGEISVL